MNTAERVAPGAEADVPRPSVALVPLAGDRGRPVQLAKPAGPGPGARAVANGSWYGGLALFITGAWLDPRGYDEVWYVLGVLCLLFGGAVGLVYTFWRVNETKLRQALAALASLALTVAAIPRVSDVSREVYAAGLVTRLQPVAETLARDRRVQQISFQYDWVELNGYYGRADGSPIAAGGREPTLDAAFSRYGITRAELEGHRRGLAAAGVSSARSADGYLVFRPADVYDAALLYVLPRHARPPRGALGADFRRWTSRPLGGGWYLLQPD